MAEAGDGLIPSWFSDDPMILRATLALVYKALDAPELSTEFARLCAIWSLILAMKPLAADEVARGQEVYRLLQEADAIRDSTRGIS